MLNLMKHSASIHWGKAFGGAMGAMVTLFAIGYLYVVFYSYVVNPGQAEAAYERHAQAAVPIVAVIAGIPLFYVLGRIAGSRETAIASWGIFALLDVGISLAAGFDLRAALLCLLDLPLKFFALRLGWRA